MPAASQTRRRRNRPRRASQQLSSATPAQHRRPSSTRAVPVQVESVASLLEPASPTSAPRAAAALRSQPRRRPSQGSARTRFFAAGPSSSIAVANFSRLPWPEKQTIVQTARYQVRRDAETQAFGCGGGRLSDERFTAQQLRQGVASREAHPEADQRA